MKAKSKVQNKTRTITKLTLLTAGFFLVACSQNNELNTAKSESDKEFIEVQGAREKKPIEVTLVDKESSQDYGQTEAQAELLNVEHPPLVNKRQVKMLSVQQTVGLAYPMPNSQLVPVFDQTENNERYPTAETNAIKLANQQPVSTFSIDVDTASYANVRRLLNQGNFPSEGVVRVEELINYFSYDYTKPITESKLLETNEPPAFSVYSEIGPSPYNQDKQLLHIGIQGESIEPIERPAANLVFLIDVSGSMNQPNKLGLLKNALKMLSHQLNKTDKVAIVVYAGAAGTVLKPTSGDNSQVIIDALSSLSAGGSTNGGAGIEAAYALARQSFIEGGINRVMLATDGDFNVGTRDQNALKALIEKQRKSGIALSVLGFGIGNYNDAIMQELAQNGDGNAYYIDTLNEARKVLVDELSSTLMIIAKDVKIQLEFNPHIVSEYRLIGYETRALKRQDFNNDKVDAGDIGAGHTVTALYEISLVRSDNQSIDPLRYTNNEAQSQNIEGYTKQGDDVNSDELAFLRLRYKQPTASESQLIEQAIKVSDIQTSINNTSNNFKFAAAVAGFGQLLQGGEYLDDFSNQQVLDLALQGKGRDQQGYRSEFINIVKLATALSPKNSDSKATIAKQ